MGRRGLPLLLILAVTASIVLLGRADLGTEPPAPPEAEDSPPETIPAIPAEPGPVRGATPPSDARDGQAAAPHSAPGPAATGTVTIRGSVVREDGLPVKGARIVLHSARAHRRWEAAVAPDGSFEIPGLPDDRIGTPVCITAGCEGLIPRMYHFRAEAARSGDIRIVLRPPVRYTGRFVDEEGRPVEGSVLTAFSTPFHSLRARTDGTGRYSFLAPAGWPGVIKVSHRSAADEVFLLPADAVSDADLGDRVVHPGAPVEGTVLDPGGEPVAGMVALYSQLGGHCVASATTDREGRFRFEDVGRGRHEVCCVLGGEGGPRMARATGIVAGRRDVRLVLRPLIWLEVRLVDAATGEAVRVDVAGLWVERVGDPDEHRWTRDTRGMRSKLLVALDRPGTYEFGLRSPFLDWESGSADVPEAMRRVEVELRLRPADDE